MVKDVTKAWPESGAILVRPELGGALIVIFISE
jgi:hypothetical protein